MSDGGGRQGGREREGGTVARPLGFCKVCVEALRHAADVVVLSGRPLPAQLLRQVMDESTQATGGCSGRAVSPTSDWLTPADPGA